MSENSFQTYADPLTGRAVVKLSPGGVLCHHPYFYNRMFSADSRFLVYAREDGGNRSLCLLDTENGGSRILIDGNTGGEEAAEDFGMNLSADGKSLFYCRGKRIIRHELETGGEETLYTSPPGWNGYSNPSFSSDDRLIVTVEIREEDTVPGTGGWDTFEPQWRKKPRCRLVLADAAAKTSRVIHEENLWLGHPQFRPYHNNDISYCHEGPATLIDARLWFIHADGSGRRCLRRQGRDELITHEFWFADGSALGYVYRRMGASADAGAKREYTGVNQRVFRLDTGTDREEYLMDCSVYCHSIASPDGTLLAGDGQDPEQPYIYLSNLREKTETVLCRHDTGWKSYGNTQDAHPHPAFSPDGKKIIFTSDRDGLPGIYMISIR